MTTPLKKIFAMFMALALLSPALVLGSPNDPPAKGLTEDQKILQVLNRLGYGARPGDIERVKAIGLDKYIEQQLNASSINDSAAEARVKGLDVFDLTTAELFAKYPNPGALLRQLDGGKRKQADAAATKDAADPQDPNAQTQAEQQERRQRLQGL
jgi:hypothetical protein